MGTKKTGKLVLETLLERPKTLTEIKRSLESSNTRYASEELEKIVLRLGRQGYLRVTDDGSRKCYIITALGQAVSENPKK